MTDEALSDQRRVLLGLAEVFTFEQIQGLVEAMKQLCQVKHGDLILTVKNGALVYINIRTTWPINKREKR